ncbi:hypothetical protein L228DRAFT_245151 [Xylona heveae TC161]|uniref:Ubiquitin-domain-containing protein n=1 Tax=Xylona heveae (strain CBS 132557 / TC161) TaxID=1328760 RepID=A0A165I1Z3_XYLHT|nr:hypothetical protein L228DRAFT_245151 [Xylona heveae TC161]KZF24245.1 hypothetical protein L228DRAFT_245151 [Xylona heveae TC161]
MADQAAPPRAREPSFSDDSPVTFTVKASNDAKYTITLTLSTTVRELKERLSGPNYADLPVERQRLIYSGRVLKDPDTLGSYKVKEGNTIHLVKGAASNQRQNPANQGGTASSTAPGSSAAAGVPTNLAAGTGNNPLAGLTGARYAGHIQLPGADMFGPDGGMGPPPDPEQMLSMLENPQFASMMNEALQNPQVIDMMIQQNPMLRNMAPNVRQMMQSPEFRRMMTDPDTIRRMTQLRRDLGMGGLGGMGGPSGDSSFPMPGVTNTTEAPRDGAATGAGSTATPSQTDTTGNTQAQQNPFASLFGNLGDTGNAGAPANPFAALLNPNNPLLNPMFAGTTPAGTPPPAASAGQGTPAPQEGQPPPNPFAALFNPAMFGGQPPTNQGAGSTTSSDQQQSNPFNNPFINSLMQNPQAMQQMMQAFGGGAGAGGANPFNPFGAMGDTPSNPPDTRPPEERYAEQLRQLNEMGFYEFERNVEALRRAGGSVQGAVEYLLTH